LVKFNSYKFTSIFRFSFETSEIEKPVTAGSSCHNPDMD